MANHSLITASTLHEFPLTLVCPRCGTPVMPDAICEKTGHPCAGEHVGIPRLLFGQRYWGETGSTKMRELLAKAREGYWRTAIESMRGESVSQHLLSPIRADFLHAMPWTQIRQVLDVGAGMGFMSCDMATYAKTVVALEAVPERAEFIKLRALQDSLPVFPIIASAMEMPFPAESFDLITLNGVFEYIGLWGQGDPKRLQQKFLGTALRLLRPGGYLYVGIETRYSMSAWLGARDHSGLAFTSLMPRAIADLYCRIRARPGYGAEHVDKGYRTYTHTPMQYDRMFREAGLSPVTVYGAYDGYNRQKVLYRMDDYKGRAAILEKVAPPASLAGKVRRRIEHNRFLYRILEQEVVAFGRKPSEGESIPEAAQTMPWAPVEDSGRTVVQINLPQKVLGVVCAQGTPIEVLEIAKPGHDDVARRLDRAYDTLTRLEREIATHGSPPISWPKPLGSTKISGRHYRRYEYVSGPTLSDLLLPPAYEAGRVTAIIGRTIRSYVDLCKWMTLCYPRKFDCEAWTTFEQQIEEAVMSDDIRRDIRSAVKVSKERQWKLSAVHGDLTAGNLIVNGAGTLVLTDWEHFTQRFVVGTDLIRFHQDILMDAIRLPVRKRQHLCRRLDELTSEALRGCGYEPENYNHLRALYIGQQILALGDEQRTYAPLLNAYREGVLPPGGMSK